MTVLNSICVFCGSRPGDNPIFIDIAQQTGKIIAESGKHLVFGAGAVGLMGASAQAALDAGGKVTGIVPEFLLDREVPVEKLHKLLTVDTMHTRKKLMYERSDAFVILPGGLGTLDELVEVVTWFQLDLHNKPVFVIDVLDYWDDWFRLIEKMAKHKFVDQEALKYFTRLKSPEELKQYF